MRAPYFIETLARNGDVLARQKIDHLPIRIGRGYGNDFILDDAHTGAEHAIIEAGPDATLLLRDLGSRNGSIHHGKRFDSIELGGQTVVRLGHTNLRVRGADYAVPAETTDTTRHDWEGLRPAVLGLTLAALTALTGYWLNDFKSFEPISYLMVLSAVLGGALIIGGAWALANRLFGNLARFGRHLFILGCGVLAIMLWQVASSTLAYAYSFEALTRYGGNVIIAIICCMIFFHLATIKPRHMRRFAAASAIMLILGTGLNLMSNLQSSGHLASEPYMSVLLPPALHRSADHTPAEFFSKAASLKSAVDNERGKAAKDDDDDDD